MNPKADRTVFGWRLIKPQQIAQNLNLCDPTAIRGTLKFKKWSTCPAVEGADLFTVTPHWTEISAVQRCWTVNVHVCGSLVFYSEGCEKRALRWTGLFLSLFLCLVCTSPAPCAHACACVCARASARLCVCVCVLSGPLLWHKKGDQNAPLFVWLLVGN